MSAIMMKRVSLFGAIVWVLYVAAITVGVATEKAWSDSTAASATEIVPYNDKGNGFCMPYPKGWEKIPDDLMKAMKAAVSAAAKEYGLEGAAEEIVGGFWSPTPHKHNFMVAKVESPRAVDLKDFYQRKKSIVEKRASILGGYEVKSEERISVDGVPAMKLVFLHLSPGGRKAESMQIYLVRDQVVWCISFSGEGDNFDVLVPTFDAIVKGFSVLKPAKE